MIFAPFVRRPCRKDTARLRLALTLHAYEAMLDELFDDLAAEMAKA